MSAVLWGYKDKDCKSIRRINKTVKVCPECNGEGDVWDGDMTGSDVVTCPVCLGCRTVVKAEITVVTLIPSTWKDKG